MSLLGIARHSSCSAPRVLVLLVSLLHPEGLRRPGGYLDGQEPQPRDDEDADA